MLPNIEECRRIIGKQIRNDTYLFMQRLQEGEKYEDIYQDLDLNREKYRIKKDTALSRECTCQKYLKLVQEEKLVANDEPWENKSGIYCIKINGNMVYIGKTLSSFKTRFKTHKRNMNNSKDLYLYRLLSSAKQAGQQLSFEPIIIKEDLELREGKHFGDKEVSIMELALIQAFQPIGNVAGRLVPYYQQKQA